MDSQPDIMSLSKNDLGQKSNKSTVQMSKPGAEVFKKKGTLEKADCKAVSHIQASGHAVVGTNRLRLLVRTSNLMQSMQTQSVALEMVRALSSKFTSKTPSTMLLP